MVIGGRDVIVPVPWSSHVRDLLETHLRRLWPGMVVDEDVSGELFYCRDAAAQNSWNEHGLTDINDDTLLHIVPGESTFTVVVACVLGAETARVAEWLREMLR